MDRQENKYLRAHKSLALDLNERRWCVASAKRTRSLKTAARRAERRAGRAIERAS